MARTWIAVLALMVAPTASAQQLVLDIRDGLVTMQATNVPVRQVLAEWARVGGTRVVGGDRLSGPPLTLHLEGVPEAKALDIVLRGAAGYVAAPRSAAGTGRSSFDRILVLATSSPPAGGAGGAAASPSFAGRAPNRFAAPQPDVVDAPDAGNDVPAPDQPQVNPFANAFGQPGMAQPFGQPPSPNPFGQPVVNPFGQPGTNPFTQPTANPFGQPLVPQPGVQPGLFQPVNQAPAGGFGVVGSSTPGVVPQPVDAQGRPRPPGR